MIHRFNFILKIILIVVCFFSLNCIAQSEVNSKIIDYLNRNDIMELIEKYGQEKISLKIKGIEQKKIEKQPYNVMNGFRCQIFAGANLQNANKVALKVESLQIDSVYVIQSSENIYKVQIGNCTTREEAQILLDKLYYAGIEGTWIVANEIHIPKKEIKKITPDTSLDAGQAFYFGVQVFTTGYLEKAQQFEKELNKRFAEPVKLIQKDNFWKIVVGYFKNRQEAEILLDKVIDEGFSDAWITQVIN